MTNKTKIIVGILIVVSIIILIICIIGNNTKKEKENSIKNGISNVSSYLDDIKAENSQIDNTINEVDSENNVITENLSNGNNKEENNNIIGKEEQESKNENTEEDNRNVAIELAKKEWNISIDSYNFEAKLKSEGIYEVSVRNKTNGYVNAVYTVNIKTGTVTE